MKQGGGMLPRPHTLDLGRRSQAKSSKHMHPRSYPILHGGQSILIYILEALGSSLAPKFIYWQVSSDFTRIFSCQNLGHTTTVTFVLFLIYDSKSSQHFLLGKVWGDQSVSK
jgi:hypothetical protein